MDYIEKMKEAMQMMHQACRMNENWSDCDKCPFDEYCDAIMRADLATPDGENFAEFDEEE